MQIDKFSERIIFLYKSNTIFCWKYKSLVQSPLYNCLEVIPAPFLASPLNISRHPCSWSNQVGMPSCPFPCNNLVQALFCFQTASMIFQWPLIGTFAKTNGLRSCNGRPPSHLCKAQSSLSTIKLAPRSKIAPKNSTTRHPAPTSKF